MTGQQTEARELRTGDPFVRFRIEHEGRTWLVWSNTRKDAEAYLRMYTQEGKG